MPSNGETPSFKPCPPRGGGSLKNRLELQRKAAAVAKPLYVLKNKKQLELRLQ